MQNVKEISLSNIQTSKVNPRTYFNEEKLKELADSIKVKGIISPILVRPLKLKDSGNKDKPVLASAAKDIVNGKFEIVYGERRFKACRLAKLENIPAIIKPLTDAEVLELQVIENLQREDLNPIEEAQGFKALLEQCKYTQEKLAGKIGKSQGYIAARLALLNLTDDFQKGIASAKLLPGHVKYLMVIADRPKILTAIRKEMGNHKEQLTVKAFEGRGRSSGNFVHLTTSDKDIARAKNILLIRRKRGKLSENQMAALDMYKGVKKLAEHQRQQILNILNDLKEQ